MVLCMDKINGSTNAHNFPLEVDNLLDTTPTQSRKIGKNNLNRWQYSVLVCHPSALIKKREGITSMRCLLSGNDFCGGPEAMGCQAHPSARLILSTHNRTPVDERVEETVDCQNTGTPQVLS